MDKIEIERRLQHHDTIMRGYDKQIADHQLRAIEAENRRKLQESEKDTEAANVRANFQRQLLNKPFPEISQHNPHFRENYELLEQTLSDWVLSQKAFKELAYDMGARLGYSEEVIDSLYLSRVTAIATGHNPNEAMPHRFSETASTSQENLHLAIAQKNSLITPTPE